MNIAPVSVVIPCYRCAIERRHGQPQDIVSRLKATGAYKFYESNLKQYPLVRALGNWIGRNVFYAIFAIYVIYIATPLGTSHAKKRRDLIKLSDFVRKKGAPVCKLVNAARVEARSPRVFPDPDQDYLAPPRDQYEFPEIIVAIIRNATTCGGTNFIFADGEVVCHDLYDFERDYTSEELHGRAIIEPKSRQIWWYTHDELPERIPVAATFVDACAPNYAHWMTEVLPRIALFCADERFKRVPIVIDDGLHENIMESLLLVAGSDREIITLPSDKAIAVDRLHVTSAAGYVPFGRRTSRVSDHSHGMFSPEAFEKLRSRLNALGQGTEDGVWPQKIYLRRDSSMRGIINAAELEQLLVARGYAIVEPEKLTFLQQLQIFRNAKAIVAPTGAGLSNAICCKRGTHVVVLMGKHKDMIYRYWSNLLAPIQVHVSYVLGNIKDYRGMGIHGNFLVDLSNVADSLPTLGEK
jgi:capsular polysaccharide biosynthesis protein